jgi:hypothetical protein
MEQDNSTTISLWATKLVLAYPVWKTPRRASIRALVPDRLSVRECRKYAIHHIIVQNIPEIRRIR